jgi:hypothetical protein
MLVVIALILVCLPVVFLGALLIAARVASNHAPRPVIRYTRLRAMPRGARKENTGTVTPKAHQLWKVRGWRQQGRVLRGAFRTHRGSCSGEISLDRRGRARDYFILSPPAALLAGSHGPCFRARGPGNRYWIHFNYHTGDIDSGITAVERLLNEALGA